MSASRSPKLVLVGSPEERDELAAALSGTGGPGIAGFIPFSPAAGRAFDVEIPPADILVVPAGFEAAPARPPAVRRAAEAGVRVVGFPSCYEELTRRTPIELVPASWIIESPGLRRLRSPAVRRAKRAFDVLGSLAALIASSPLTLVIAVLVKATSRGPVFFREKGTTFGSCAS